MKNIGWFSRNVPLPAQLRELEQKLGKCTVIEHKQMFGSAADVIALAKKWKVEHAVIVAPMSMIAKVVEVKDTGVVWLWARMDPVHPDRSCPGSSCVEFNADRDVIVPNSRGGSTRHHRFIEFNVIKRIDMILEPF
jgi:hypothetical protein